MVQLTDVTLRDGLQMEAFLPNEKKLELYRRLLPCGYDRLEVTSFVNPKWVPQFQDSEAFAKAVTEAGGGELMAFVPNAKGLDRLLAFPIRWVSLFVAVSEAFNKKNVNQSIDETLVEAGRMIEKARSAGRRSRLYVSTVFGCPYEGKIAEDRLEKVLGAAARLGPDEIALSDTIGVAVPSQIDRVLGLFKRHFPVDRTVLHLHDTYGLAVAGCLTAYRAGVRSFDGSSGGIGGCPYAKGATGNVAIEKLAYAFFREGARAEFPLAGIRPLLEWLGANRLPFSSSIGDILKKGGAFYGMH